ncbi:caspase family protein [Abyssibius alkaniclasticus]|uniref:caspase family protein n=1 Tax=Abyssibius alkaniclasticus TaxID=2881234 RepID=UPI0023633A22|nr:caspase family protein [Abyssibius alkaniclasticus]UPH72054.1 caspase family protein [Abyssibius alkaniclasticus]
MLRLSFMRAITLFIALILGTASQAQSRWAVIVGNSVYDDPGIVTLPNTVNDARAMAGALSSMGFSIYLLEDATRADVAATFAEIAANEQGAELGLFFYAGHGVQHEGINYLLPADIRPTSRSFLQEQAFALPTLIDQLAQLQADKLVIVLDACRNSPFGEGQASGVGLALTEAPPNTIISYATSPGAVALDGAGANSPFTAALASTLEGPRQDFRDVLRLVRAKVRRATNGEQTPWYIDNATEEIWLDPNPAIVLDAETQAAVTGNINLASVTWNTIRSSADQTDFQLFVELFPEDQLAPVASRQLQLLEESGVEPLGAIEIATDDTAQIVPGGLTQLITQCDILATPDNDPYALVEGVPHDLVNTRAAIRACIQALEDDPGNARITGLLARALSIAGRDEEALFFFQLAADRGYATAYGDLAEAYRIGRGVEIDEARAAEYLRLGALAGMGNLRVALGEFYREGWGVPQSYAEARRWFEVAAQNGQVNAVTALGDIYRRGQGVEADEGRALGFYLSAAANGQSDAMNNVGLAYLRGEGVTRNYPQAIYWLTRATDEGNPYAPLQLGRMFMKGWGVDADGRQALAYFRLSAQRNFVNAYEFIGDMLAGFEGVEEDLPAAYANYMIAYEGGLLRDTSGSRQVAESAAEKMAALEARMSAAQLEAGRATAEAWIAEYGVLDFNLVNR